jgi:ATP-dependent helicase HrpA
MALARRQLERQVRDLGKRAANLCSSSRAELRWLPQLEELRWWIEEYRVSLYAQELKTPAVPISAARLQERAAAIEAGFKR